MFVRTSRRNTLNSNLNGNFNPMHRFAIFEEVKKEKLGEEKNLTPNGGGDQIHPRLSLFLYIFRSSVATKGCLLVF